MDLGLSKLVTPALEWLCELVGQYGLAIIIATVLMKLVLLPLDIYQRRASLKMQALKPKVDEINKRFANDAQKKQQAVQQLYKKEGVNTLSGCLPLLIQLPVFVAFFNAMRTISNKIVYNLYQLAAAGDTAGFDALMARCKFLWIGNVFQPDAIFTVSLKSLFGGTSSVVPVIPDATAAATAFKALGVEVSDYADVMANMIAKYDVRTNGLFIIAAIAGVASYFQQKLTPVTTADPQQQNTMKGMMIFMTAFSVYLCATYNAAFGLYWMATMAIGMIVQIILNRIYNPERLAAKATQSGPLDAFPDRAGKRSARKENSDK